MVLLSKPPAVIRTISQYCLFCARDSYVKRSPDGSPRLYCGPQKHFLVGTWLCWHSGPRNREGGLGFGCGSELLFARSQLSRWGLPLPSLAQMQCICVCVYVHKSDGTFRRMFACVVNPAQSHTTEVAALCQ